jgi:NADPH2:quinone reductase
MKAIVVTATGGPEQLELKDIPAPRPGPGEALVRVQASGVNFIDIYQRSGLYKLDLPFVPGSEGAGIVEEVGPDAAHVKTGDRVAWAMTRGSYAEYAVVPAWQLVPVPEGIHLETAAAAMLQGMTAHYLVRSTFPLKQGHAALVHAAAGGVGLLLVQMAKELGAYVIGTASTEEKRELVRQTGADEAIPYEGFVEKVRELTGGRGVDVVYDSVGKDTFLQGFDCLRPRGMMVTFGQSSGANADFNPLLLSQKGSLFLTRPVLSHYIQTREELLWRAGDILNGTIQYRIGGRYALPEAAQAHRDLASRKTTGKLVLVI